MRRIFEHYPEIGMVIIATGVGVAGVGWVGGEGIEGERGRANNIKPLPYSSFAVTTTTVDENDVAK